jgi:hypothetical protein
VCCICVETRVLDPVTLQVRPTVFLRRSRAHSADVVQCVCVPYSILIVVIEIALLHLVQIYSCYVYVATEIDPTEPL